MLTSAVEATMPKKSKPLVAKFGTMWARNADNIKKIPRSRDGGYGVYILFHGSMPMYVGKGNIRSRIRTSARTDKRARFWDRFSWYALKDKRYMHEIEALVLQIFPPNLRSLTRQSGKFVKARRPIQQSNEIPVIHEVKRRKRK
jgi:hypothetical protein